ncbi:MAG TPA: Gfo/Idh/MocA family oxidoreductase [Casimicrobiaceae bacterium]|nr:Gfo/Idh/MocA family oxidoreductase [Casimicrobiaceae bacterium]
MNLHRMLQARADAGTPLRIALIGAGKFGAMYLAQAKHTPGIHIVGIADLAPERARAALVRTGWAAERYVARSTEDAVKRGKTLVTDDAFALIASPEVEIVIDATGNPAAGIAHALACCEHGKHVVMVNVEADALAGPLLAQRARDAGIVYSLAYGDQPALICEMVDWCRAAGFEVVAAGKGTKYLPAYHASTPATVWPYYGFTPEMVAAGDFNAQMFNSFLDGTKSAIEMAAVANATGLTPAPDGLAFPPCGVDDLPRILRPHAEGGTLHHAGQVEVISSLERDGTPVLRDLRWGVYVTFRAGDAAGEEYVRRCFREYGFSTDPSGRYSAMYKPYHAIGLELGISIASAGLRREPTGQPLGWHADVVATAKRDLAAGELLDGEGGYTVYGSLMPAADSLQLGGLPLGLAHGMRLARPVAANAPVRWADVVAPAPSAALDVRRAMERLFGADATPRPAAERIAETTTRT